MTNKKQTKKKKCDCKKSKESSVCKHLCIDCKHSYNLDFDTAYDFVYATSSSNKYYCKKYEKVETVTNCVDGIAHDETHYALCSKHNKNGNCEYFTPQPNARLISVLKLFLEEPESKSDWACRNPISTFLARDLLNVLNGANSDYLERIYTFESPYSHSVVVTKKAIRDSISARCDNIECSEDNFKYNDYTGAYGAGLSTDEICEEKSFVKCVKRFLGAD